MKEIIAGILSPQEININSVTKKLILVPNISTSLKKGDKLKFIDILRFDFEDLDFKKKYYQQKKNLFGDKYSLEYFNNDTNELFKRYLLNFIFDVLILSTDPEGIVKLSEETEIIFDKKYISNIYSKIYCLGKEGVFLHEITKNSPAKSEEIFNEMVRKYQPKEDD